jgi:glycosyltransferase involved in cell wall biosynthesis
MLHHADGNAGGGQVQMGRLRIGLRNCGVDARVLCRHKALEDSVLIPRRPLLERGIGKFTKRLGLNDIHQVGSNSVLNLQEFKDADVLDIHCLHSETFSYLGLPALTARKPVVFTFHDMWPITGRCHASLDCERWKTGCGKCPYPEIYPAAKRDATGLEWKLKNWVYRRSEFSIVAPSRWLCDKIQDSMLSDTPIHHVPHGVDLEVFKPLDREQCREKLGISREKKVILFAAESMSRPLKGADLLVQTLKSLPEVVSRDCVLLVFGETSDEILKQVPMPVVELGYLNNDHLKAIAYSAADLLLNSSRAESFGLVVLESIACGTPVVSFGVGGVRELVRPGTTGFLADAGDPVCLGVQVVEFFGDRPRAEALTRQCRQVALAEYSINTQVQRYREIYQLAIDAKNVLGSESLLRKNH